MNSMISLDDNKTELAVVTDVTMGGSSMTDGSLEIMLHRRCQVRFDALAKHALTHCDILWAAF